MRTFTGEDFIAVTVRHTNGRVNYFLTLGRFWWQSELKEIAAAVLARTQGFALDGEPQSAEVCYSLTEASAAPYFFEHLLALSRVPLPDCGRMSRAEADRAAEAIHTELLDGRHLYFCGSHQAFDRYRRNRDGGPANE